MDELDKKLFNDLSEKVEIPVKCEYVIKNAFNNNAKKSKNSIKQILSTIIKTSAVLLLSTGTVFATTKIAEKIWKNPEKVGEFYGANGERIENEEYEIWHSKNINTNNYENIISEKDAEAQINQILKKFGYSEEDIELVKIAGFMHDIGNVVNRKHHAEYGAILANEILKKTDMSMKDRITVVSAIGHHDESTGGATDPVSAALIIADKTDVRRNRVREKAKENFDIHDRVNYAVTDAALKINIDKKVIALNLQIDTSICSMYEYFDIFLGRMMMCRGAAGILGATFKLTANGSKVL